LQKNNIMSNEIKTLEPQALWKNFALLNAVPRPSREEERVIAFMKSFGESLGLSTIEDHIGNVIIKKPGTAGRENQTTIVLQSHLDMVHQRNADTDFDFKTQGIQMYVDGDWVKAKGTTLGADNGIGVAAIMGLLESKDISHPPLEALFTIDEETGMTGAMELKGGMLDAKIMLNLDTEDDNELTIGCAGGIDITANGAYDEDTLTGMETIEIALSGLSGGHSGMDIHKGLGNSNKVMNRLLFFAAQKVDLRIHSINGGSLRNAIPRESFAVVLVHREELQGLINFVGDFAAIIKNEYGTTDPDLDISIKEALPKLKVISKDFQSILLRSIYACPNGIYRMSPDVDGLVQTSNNLAKVSINDGEYSILCLTRSSVDSEKMDEAAAIQSTFELMGADVILDGDYPGWTPRPTSKIVSLMSDLYTELFKEPAHVNACHAGLECGILGTNYPEMEMISFGPNIKGAHSPDERCQISSVQKFWGFLIETLKRIS
jgi:dipeptidase D